MDTKDAQEKGTQKKRMPFRHSMPTAIVRHTDGKRYLLQGGRYYSYAEYDRATKKYLPYPYEVDIDDPNYTNKEIVSMLVSYVSNINNNLTKLNNLVAYLAKKQEES